MVARAGRFGGTETVADGREPMTSRRLLVVEDQDLIAEAIGFYLGGEGYAVDHAGDLAQARDRLGEVDYDLVILDMRLPDGDGLQLVEQLQRPGSPAVVVVSARGEESDRVLALEAGADDYVVKPFSLRELAARVRGVLRRSRAEGEALAFGDYRLEPSERRLRHTERGEVALTTAEYEVLFCLAASPGEAVDRETLTRRALGRDWHPLDRSVDQIVVSLRRKLDGGPAGEQAGEQAGETRIVTVRGRGYLLRQGRD